MATPTDTLAFPTLDETDMEVLRPVGREQLLADGEYAQRAGEADVDFVVILSGALAVLNPLNDNRLIATHEAGGFLGDIDLITRRPVLAAAVAKGPTTVLRVPGAEFRRLLNVVPRLSEKVLVALQVRRKLLSQQHDVAGVRLFGPAICRETTEVREFLYKNFIPADWVDTATDAGRDRLAKLNRGTKTPLIEFGSGKILQRPSLHETAEAVGVWQGCPTEDVYDLAIVGCGPAGMSAAVYAASEGLKVIVLDRLGPGGQAAGSSRIENFIGFPAGLSGTDLATRAVLQMMKFGSYLATPIGVNWVEPAPPDGDEPHVLHLDCGASLRANTVLAATGVAWRKLTVPGADKFERAGVYYACTSVEVAAHQKTDVCVVGGGNSAGQAAMYLSEHCAKTVHVLVRGPALAATMSDYLSNRLTTTPNIKLHFKTEVAEVFGDRRIEAVDVKPKGADANDRSKRERIDCSAVFVFIGAEPHADWLPEGVLKDDLGYVQVGPEVERSGKWPLADRAPCPLETTVPRIMAAGDVRAGTTKRVGFAVGDGSLAVTCAHKLRNAERHPDRSGAAAQLKGLAGTR